jgi:hypothetical protein
MEGNENTQMKMMTFCEICGMAFIDRVQLNEHLTLVHKEGYYQCQSCNKIFEYKNEFEQHMRIHFEWQQAHVFI